MKKILAVDDSPSVRRLVKMSLPDNQYEVIEAGDGAQGLACARANVVHMVVTDLNMPVMNGLDFIRELRKLPAYCGVPVVFLTTEWKDEMKKAAKAAGATGWMTKPFQQEQLLALVKKVIG